MDFKKFASDAGTLFNRAKQYTEEKLGHAEKTELDPQLDNLIQRGDKTKQWTEQILSRTETMLQPNPGVRMEEFMYEKIQGKRPERLVESDILGQHMIDGGNELGYSGTYGSTLIKVGQTQQKIGQAQREYIKTVASDFLQPISSFLNGDMKTIQKEKSTLETKRLDLDAAKSKLKRCKSQPARQEAEQELRIAQNEFDRQCEVTRLLLEGLNGAYAHHHRCLQDFVAAEMNYYAQCNQYMKDLQRQLGMPTTTGQDNDVATSRSTIVDSRLYAPTGNGSTVVGVANSIQSDSSDSKIGQSGSSNDRKDLSSSGNGQKARVLYDYDAADMSELSLAADEVIQVYHLPNQSSDWMLGVRGQQRGKIPIAYINII